jgi:hypothetical protein
MLSLASLDNCAAGYSTSHGRLVVVMPPAPGDVTGKGRAWEVLTAEFDELERLDWIVLEAPQEGDAPNTARVRVTDAGKYWLKRWAGKSRRELVKLAAQERAVV